MAGEIELSQGIPFEIAAEVSFGPRIGVDRVPFCRLLLIQIAAGPDVEMGQVTVAHAAFHLGNDGIVTPRLETQEYAVVQPHHMERIGALPRIDVKGVVVKLPTVLILGIDCVRVHLVVHRPFAGGPQVNRGQVLVQGVFPYIGRVPPVLQVFDEGEGDADGLVEEDRTLGILVGRGSEKHPDFLNVLDGRVPDSGEVDDTAVLGAVDGIPDDAAVGQKMFSAGRMFCVVKIRTSSLEVVSEFRRLP